MSASGAWHVDFYSGYVGGDYRSLSVYVRLERAGQ